MGRRRLLLVAGGGAAGAALRWGLLDLGGEAFRPVLLGVNVLGCVVLGWAVATEGPAGTDRHRWLHDAVAVGFCGGLTTFSTLAVEVAELGRDGQPGFAAWYLGGVGGAGHRRGARRRGVRRTATGPRGAAGGRAVIAVAFLVAAGLGATARALVGHRLNPELGFPWGTVVVNVTGSFLLGLLVGLDAPALTVLGTGLLGAFTTLSSFARDAVALVERRQVAAAAGYVLLTCAATVAAAAAGLALA